MDCPKCRKPISAGAPVWRMGYAGRFGPIYSMCCEACLDGGVMGDYYRQKYEAQGPRHCKQCDRLIYGWYKRTWHCSEECRLKTQTQRVSEEKARLRQERPCPQCGETFKPKRSDGRYCSGRCRMAAFRAAKSASAA